MLPQGPGGRGAWRFRSHECAERYFAAGPDAFRMEVMLIHRETHKGKWVGEELHLPRQFDLRRVRGTARYTIPCTLTIHSSHPLPFNNTRPYTTTTVAMLLPSEERAFPPLSPVAAAALNLPHETPNPPPRHYSLKKRGSRNPTGRRQMVRTRTLLSFAGQIVFGVGGLKWG